MTLSCVVCALRTDAVRTAQLRHLETKLRCVAGHAVGSVGPLRGDGPAGWAHSPFVLERQGTVYACAALWLLAPLPVLQGPGGALDVDFHVAWP